MSKQLLSPCLPGQRWCSSAQKQGTLAGRAYSQLQFSCGSVVSASELQHLPPNPLIEGMHKQANAVNRAIQEEQVSLATYDEAWPAQFTAERKRLVELFPQLLEVEHFGSTAIPRMPAKPIIDVLAGVESMTVADLLFEPILTSGYTTSRAFNAMLPDRRWFMRAANGQRTHHLHIVELGGKQWVERLRFRDILRSNAGLALQYAKLKSELAMLSTVATVKIALRLIVRPLAFAGMRTAAVPLGGKDDCSRGPPLWRSSI